MPTCWIVAGPNGSGKTTFAMEYLPKAAGCINFVNADLIAAAPVLLFEQYGENREVAHEPYYQQLLKEMDT